MKIDVFDYIKSAAAGLNEKRKDFESAARELCGYLNSILKSKDDDFTFTHRIKSAESLKEKILRYELYKTIGIDELFENLSDVIGIRIGCRFLKDEPGIYEKLRYHFFMKDTDGYFFHPGNKDVCLKMDTLQPESQRNGFNIYRIDGYIIRDGERFRFELQIKSLINNFWSDIEHKIIYKNKRYLGGDSFIKDLMNLIYANLVNIDTQLSMLFARNEDRSNTEFFSQTQSIITIMMDELSSELIEYKTGIAVSMSGYSERLVKYILSHSSFKTDTNPKDIYSGIVLNLITRLQSIEFMQIPIGEKLSMPLIAMNTEFEHAVCSKFCESLNNDFYVNAFFHILFALETGTAEEDFARFTQYFCDILKKDNPNLDDCELIELIKERSAQELLTN